MHVKGIQRYHTNTKLPGGASPKSRFEWQNLDGKESWGNFGLALHVSDFELETCKSGMQHD